MNGISVDLIYYFVITKAQKQHVSGSLLGGLRYSESLLCIAVKPGQPS